MTPLVITACLLMLLMAADIFVTAFRVAQKKRRMDQLINCVCADMSAPARRGNLPVAVADRRYIE